MPYAGDTYSLPAGTAAVSNATANSTHVNSRFTDLEAAQNAARPVVAGGTGATTASAARTALGLVIGTNVQAYDAGLASIAGLTTAADRGIYTTASDTYAVFTLTSAGRALLDDANAAAQRTTLGLGGLATLDILDEDDMASDSATRPPSQQSTKAYVDAQVGAVSTGYTVESAVATTSGQTINLATGLSGVSEFSVFFQNVGLSGASDSVLVQLGTSGGFVTTGYVSESAFGTSVASSTGGFLSRLLGSSREMIGEMRFTHMGSNLWRASHATNYGHGGGYITLGGALTQIRLQVSGTPTDSFDNGSAQVAYKT